MNNIISLSGNLLLIICLATSMLQSLNLFTANSYTNNNVKLFLLERPKIKFKTLVFDQYETLVEKIASLSNKNNESHINHYYN